ncbi:MAG: IclR family transcriptional regulator [Pseudomonadales bacterium]
MQTVDKAMKILGLFSTKRPEIGLSELSRLAKIDKAGTRRLLVALQKHAFIEQNLETRDYRLGIGFLQLARIREATSPMVSIVEPILHKLTQVTEETAHASLSAGTDNSMMSIGISPSTRVIRVHLQDDEPLPIHATASGIGYLAFSSEERFAELIGDELEAYTSTTVRTVSDLKKELAATRERGYAISNQGYENEVYGIAAPFFDALGAPLGSVAVASPTSRMDPQRERDIAKLVIAAAQEATQALGGTLGVEFATVNSEHLS